MTDRPAAPRFRRAFPPAGAAQRLRRAAALVLFGGLLLGAAAPPPPAPAPDPAARPAGPPPASIAAAPAPAAAPPSAPTPARQGPAPFNPQAALQKLAALGNALPNTTSDGQLLALEQEAAALGSAAQTAAAGLRAPLAQVDHEIALHSPGRGRRPTLAERRELAPLLQQRSGLTADLSADQKVLGTADALYRAAAERRREGFTSRILARSNSPLSPQFWSRLTASAGSDLSRVNAAGRDEEAAIRLAPEPRGLLFAAAGLTAALLILLPARRRLLALHGRRNAPGRDPLLKTGRGLWLALIYALAGTAGAQAVRLGLVWGGLLSADAQALAGALVGACIWCSAVVGLGRGIQILGAGESAAPRRGWSFGSLLWAVGLLTGAGSVLRRLNYVVGASVAATIATNCIFSLAYALVAGLLLIRLQAWARSEADPKTGLMSSSSRSAVTLLLAAAIIATLAAVFMGYSTLAALISGQIFWLSVVAAGSFLLLRWIDEASGGLVRHEGRLVHSLAALTSLRPATLSQVGLLFAALLQLLLIFCALTLALTPFGQAGELLISRLASLGRTIQIGQVRISPTSIIVGFGVLALGLGFAHLVRRWVLRRYLPATDWDSGLQNSVSTGVGYLGVSAAVVAAASAMGLGFQQIALVASALSVGIGFGLQQVVQNFVSGVILLVERPIKVGDWIVVGGVEGDVRRIRVRATEIQGFDRSTIIVPNSSLITTNVQNRTLGDPRARFQLQISVTKPQDARRAQDLILRAASGREEVLKEPAPAVFIDAVAAGGAVTFTCNFFVADPRQGHRTRSDLFFDVLEAFDREGVTITPP